MQSSSELQQTEAKPFVILASFNQNSLIKKFKLKSEGLCEGITDFWLCQHKFTYLGCRLVVVWNESALVRQIELNFCDVILKQKKWNEKKKKTLSDLGLVTFKGKDAISMPGLSANIEHEASKTFNEKVIELVSGLRAVINRPSSTQSKFINFIYSWVSDEKVASVEDEVNGNSVEIHAESGKVRKSHSVGVIVDLCPGCEILFFDPNTGSLMFAKKEDFLEKAKIYFKKVLQKSGGVPCGWSSTLIVEVSAPKLQMSFLQVHGNFKPKKLDYVVDIAPESVLSSILVDLPGPREFKKGAG